MENKLSFRLSSEQHEILLALEKAAAAADVAAQVRRDPSVVSRTFKAIAEIAPLVEKIDGHWRITELGKQFNRVTADFLEAQERILNDLSAMPGGSYSLPVLGSQVALLLLGTQKGFLDRGWGQRNNPDAEKRMEKILGMWREKSLTVIFAAHHSRRENSPLNESSCGNEFLPNLTPKLGEVVIKKSFNSAFIRSCLDDALKQLGIKDLILMGFTTSLCVDSTARAASDLGYRVFVVSDATVAFARRGPDGKIISADEIHSAALASLDQEYATILHSVGLVDYLGQ